MTQAPKGNALFGNWEDNLPPGSPLPPGQQHQDFGYWKSSVDDPISVRAQRLSLASPALLRKIHDGVREGPACVPGETSEFGLQRIRQA